MNKNKSQRLKKIVSLSVLALIVIFFVFYLKNNISDFKQLSISNPFYLVLLIGLFVLGHCILGLVLKLFLQPFQIFLENKEAFYISVANGFYNHITPFRGGAAARAVYLKEKHGLLYVHFLATFSANFILVFLVSSFTGIIATLWIYSSEGIFSWMLFCVFLGVFVPLLLIVIFSPKLKESPHKWLNRFIQVINGWHMIKNNRKIIALVFLLLLIFLLTWTLSTQYKYLALGILISFPKCMFLASVHVLSLLISITPANLGISEAITVFSATTIGITPIQSLSASILGRLVGFVVLFSLGPIFTHLLVKFEPDRGGRPLESTQLP